MVKVFFSIFQFDVKDYFINFEISYLIVGCYKDSPGVRIWPTYMDNKFLLVFEIRQFSRKVEYEKSL